jgi:ribosomal subunit interface protein
MEVDIIGRNVDITDRFREYASEKSDKVAHLADRALALEVRVSRHSEKPTGASAGEDRVELTIVGPGPLIRAESSAADKYAAFDLALGRLLERVRRAKDKRKVHRGKHRPTSLYEASAQGFSTVDVTPADAEVLEKVATGSIAVVGSAGDDEADVDDAETYSPVVIREKVFPAECLTVDEAVDRMELVGHDFFLFVEAEFHRPSVVYRRKGWDYGVIALDGSESVARSA